MINVTGTWITKIAVLHRDFMSHLDIVINGEFYPYYIAVKLTTAPIRSHLKTILYFCCNCSMERMIIGIWCPKDEHLVSAD